MGKLKAVGKDAKDLIIGNDGSENEADDLKTELGKSIKNGEFSKANGTILLTSREYVEKFGKKIEKVQEAELQAILEEKEYETPEEALEAEKKKEKEKKKQQQKQNEMVRKVNEQMKTSNKVKNSSNIPNKQEKNEKIKEN